MGGFRLVDKALRDVAGILSYLHRESGANAADIAERRLFTAFDELVRMPALGHRRTDLTTKNVLFHLATPYVIVFRRAKGTVRILRVMHGSRDLSNLLSIR